MRIGIIDSGNIGSVAAELFVDAGHEVAISNSRGPESLTGMVAELGPDAPLEERLALFLSGDDPAAKATVAGLIEAVGFVPLDVGSLADGRLMEPGSPIYNDPTRLRRPARRWRHSTGASERDKNAPTQVINETVTKKK